MCCILVEIWSIVDVLRDAAAHPEYSFKLNQILVKKIIGYIIQLNNICTDRMGSLHNKIHPLKYDAMSNQVKFNPRSRLRECASRWRRWAVALNYYHTMYIVFASIIRARLHDTATAPVPWMAFLP